MGGGAIPQPETQRMATLNSISTQPSLVVSVSDLPGIIGLGLTRINELIKSGELPARKAGRRTLILRTDVEAFLQNLPVVGQ